MLDFHTQKKVVEATQEKANSMNIGD